MQSIPANPFAAPVDNGMNPAAPVGYVDVDFTYTYDVVLTANQVLNGQAIQTTNDADFLWRAIVVAQFTGTFNVRFYDSQGYSLSSSLIASVNIQGDASSPSPIFPEMLIPLGGKIGIDIVDTSGSQNVIELLCRGVKRYRVNP